MNRGETMIDKIINKVKNKEEHKKYDVGILGWWYGNNYGSMLTYFALNKTIKNLGLNPVMIHESLGYNGYRVKWGSNIPPMEFARRQGYNYTDQQNFKENESLNKLTDTFMVGSDQLWNPHVGRVNDDLFLDFTNNDKKRIAYATSFGNADNKKYTPSFIKKHSQNLKRFDAISVRENYAVKTAKDIFGVDATQVVDPVFLLDREEYSKLADKATVRPEGKYMLSFILDPNENKKNVITSIAKKLSFDKVYIITDAHPKQIEKAKEVFSDPLFTVIEEIKPENYLYAYENAGYVITDSFHGSCFSFIFQKPFSVFYNTTRGADRFINLMDLFGLGNQRRIYETNTNDDILNNENVSFNIDFEKGNLQVLNERKKSFEWLKHSLCMKKLESKIIPKGSVNLDETIEILKKSFNSQTFDLFKGEKASASLISADFSLNKTKEVKNIVNSKTKFWTMKDTELIFLGKDNNILMTFDLAQDGQVIDNKIRLVGKAVDGSKRTLKTHESQHRNVPLNKLRNVAIPEDLPSRVSLIQSIRQSKHVMEWKNQLTQLAPELVLYIGRELKEYTHNKVGGPADILVMPKNIDEIKKILFFAKRNSIPVTFLGKGTNVLIRDGGIRGIVIIAQGLDYYHINGDEFTVGTSASLTEAAYYLLEHEKSNLEWAVGIPGTIGGAVYMNAGTTAGNDISNFLLSVKYIDENGEVNILEKDQLQFRRRFSIFHERESWFILEATFKVKDGNKSKMQAAMQNTVQIREDHFPLEYPQHGSTFKWWRAPRLIQQAGLVGTTIGGAKISEKQPGFFINFNQASASDYEALINYAIAEVYKFSGFLMEPEVEIIGENLYQSRR